MWLLLPGKMRCAGREWVDANLHPKLKKRMSRVLLKYFFVFQESNTLITLPSLSHYYLTAVTFINKADMKWN